MLADIGNIIMCIIVSLAMDNKLLPPCFEGFLR